MPGTFLTKPRKPLKRSGFKKKATKPLKKSTLKKKSPKKTARAKKMEMKRLIIEQYGLPNLECRRYGTTKGATRTDILKGMLWNVFARYIRRRDEGKCISCGAFKTYEELQAGHFVPAGGNDTELCFSEKNVNGECATCNADFDGWHLVPMKTNLIVKIGQAEVEKLEQQKAMKKSVKWEEADYVQRIFHYNELLTK